VGGGFGEWPEVVGQEVTVGSPVERSPVTESLGSE